MGVVALPARAQAGRPDRRRRAAARRERPGPALARRGLRPGDPRPVAARREVPRLEPRRDRRAARPRLPRGDLRRAVVRRGARRGGARGAARWTRGTIVALLPDGGWKYLSAGTFTPRPRRDGGRPRGRRQLVVSGGDAGPRTRARCRVRSRATIARGDRRPRPGRVPERGVRPDRRRPRRRPAGGAALRFEPRRNEAASPYRYEIDPDDLLRLTIETDDADEVFWAIVHSHVRSPGRPVADRHRRSPSTRTRCTSSSRSRRTRPTPRPASRRSARGGSSTARSTRSRWRSRDRPPHADRRSSSRVAGWLGGAWRSSAGRCSAGTAACSTPSSRRRRSSARRWSAGVVVALWCIRRRSAGSTRAATSGRRELGTRDLAGLDPRRAAACSSPSPRSPAAAGWLLGHPLPLVVALVIAGVDILETSFLLLVVAFRRDG